MMVRFRGHRSPLALALTLVSLVGCAESPAPGEEAEREAAPAEPAASDVLVLAAAKVALPPPGVEPADLPDPESAGAQAVVKYCVTCHELPSPGSHSATDWPAVVRRMWYRMGRLPPEFNISAPDIAERLVTLRYLVDNALQVSNADLPTAPGRDLFATTCGQCHALPAPRQHTSAEWAAVVTRMAQHMPSMLGKTLPRRDREQIMGYLERASRGGG